MAILIDENTKVLVQGITGKEGSKSTKDMLDYGTKVLCGVTPGKGGQEVHGIPVYNTIKEALKEHDVNTSIISVPPLRAKEAAFEAIENNIPLINLISEQIPIHDTSKILQYAKEKNIRIVGPSSIGIISPGKAKIGYIGGSENKSFLQGNVGIISKSGGMCSETALILKQKNIGQSTVLGTGGDELLGTDFVDALKLFRDDKETKAIVLFGEIGGSYEEEAAKYIIETKYEKPVIAFISGKFTSQFPNITFGHAGAIIEGNKGTRENKIKELKKAGVLIAEVHHEIADLVKGVM
ncbi:succinate--CoA ligase subunit alpha [archaeon]|nr:succinate--CoA ligase subunit alpha [archaeon]